MKFYMAPLEGLTGYAYRNAYEHTFHNIDKYFAPFISSNHENKMTSRERSDILPENNEKIQLVPQILSCNAEDFIHTAEEIAGYGYQEINLNLGCPSGTVTAKRKGAGFLLDPWELDHFLDRIFAGSNVALSVKTRIGYEDPEEFEDLLTIYNKYPMKELIIHPRTRKDFYKNTPNWDVFSYAMEKSRNPLIYNGDINSVEDYERLMERFPDLQGVMLGRGILMDPGLVDKIQGRRGADRAALRELHDAVYHAYQGIMSGDRNVLFRMKEFWLYFGCRFQEPEKYLKKIRKSEHLDKYEAAVDTIFTQLELTD